MGDEVHKCGATNVAVFITRKYGGEHLGAEVQNCEGSY